MPKIATSVGITSDKLNAFNKKRLPGNFGSLDNAMETGMAIPTLSTVDRKACQTLNFITR